MKRYVRWNSSRDVQAFEESDDCSAWTPLVGASGEIVGGMMFDTASMVPASAPLTPDQQAEALVVLRDLVNATESAESHEHCDCPYCTRVRDAAAEFLASVGVPPFDPSLVGETVTFQSQYIVNPDPSAPFDPFDQENEP